MSEVDTETSSTSKLFVAEAALRNEINQRAWKYLEKIGYKPWRGRSGMGDEPRMNVLLIERKPLSIISIDTEFEQDHKRVALMLEVPITHFDTLVGRAKDNG